MSWSDDDMFGMFPEDDVPAYELNDEVSSYLAAQRRLVKVGDEYKNEVNAYNTANQEVSSETSKYNAEKLANMLEISKEDADTLLIQKLSGGLEKADTNLSDTEKMLKLKNAQNKMLQEQLKQKRRENREMLDKIMKQDDELATIERELMQALQEQQVLKKELTPTYAPPMTGTVSYAQNTLQFISG
jgi:chromosome segregation ATPase